MAAPQGGDVTLVFVPVATAKAVTQGDLAAVADDGTMYKASEQTWDTDLATTRAAFVTKFFGTASQNKKSDADIEGNNGPNAAHIRLSNGGIHTFTCANGTYRNGITLVGPAKDTGNNLLDQKVETVASQAQAIGIVVRNGGSATNPGTVDVLVLSTRLPAARQ